MPIVNQCCCVGRLENGCKAIGIFCIVSRCLSLLSSIITLSNFNTFFITQRCSADWNELWPYVTNSPLCKWQYTFDKDFVFLLRRLLITGIISLVFFLIMDILLLYGVTKKRRGFLLPWIITQSLALIGMVIAIIVLSIIINNYAIGGILAALIIFALIALGIDLYFVLVVISHYQELGELPNNISTYGYPTSSNVANYVPPHIIQNQGAIITSPAYTVYPNPQLQSMPNIYYPQQPAPVAYQAVMVPNPSAAHQQMIPPNAQQQGLTDSDRPITAPPSYTATDDNKF